MKLNRPPGPRLGELLEKRGRISRDILLDALRHQRTNAGRIGTCLLEIAAIGEDDLLDVLSDQLKVPFTPPEELRSLAEEVVKLLPEKVARQRFAVPLRVSSTHITVAMRDPTDLLALDEVAFVTGRRIRVQVTSELRILEALAKYYGVELAGRFTKLLDKLNRERFLWSQGAPESAPPGFVDLPPLRMPDRSPDPRDSDSGTMRAIRPGAATATTPPSGSSLAPIVSVYDASTPAQPAPSPRVTVPIPVDATPAAPSPRIAPPPAPVAAPPPAPAVTPTTAPVSSVVPPPPAVTPVSSPLLPASPPAPFVAPTPPVASTPATSSPGAAKADSPPAVAPATASSSRSFAELAERLSAPSGRDEIGQILIEFARPRATAALLLMVRRNEAAGWLGFGPGLDDESVESCRVDLRAASFVRTLREGAALHRGALAPVPAHAEIRAMLSTNWATDLLALPLRMREKLVGVLVLTLEEGVFAPEAVDELSRLVAKASAALELVVLRQKLHAS